MESSSHPPRASTTRGMNVYVAPGQLCACSRIFLVFLWPRAWPAVVAALSTKARCKGLTTVTSNAAGFPSDQMGRYTSAGRARDRATNPGISLRGARAAELAAENSASLRELCRRTRPLSPLHPTWWSPNRSAWTLQHGQGALVDARGRPSQYRRHMMKSGLRMCSPRAGDGSAVSHAPALGRPDESTRARSLVDGAEARTFASREELMAAESSFCAGPGGSASILSHSTQSADEARPWRASARWGLLGVSERTIEDTSSAVCPTELT